MAAETTTRPSPLGNATQSRRSSHPMSRPLPLRASSESETSDGRPQSAVNGEHNRHQSTYHAFRPRQVSSRRLSKSEAERKMLPTVANNGNGNHEQTVLPVLMENGEVLPSPSNPTPPLTPVNTADDCPEDLIKNDMLIYDFTRIDYELDRARSIGSGLWSTVYFGQPVIQSPKSKMHTGSTPPMASHPKSTAGPPCSLYAVKVAARPDAKDIFTQEAKTLTKLQQSPDSHQHIVSFYGFDERSSSLIFEGVVGGSLESLVTRLKTMTELERHLELCGDALFFRLAYDLISGLKFIHTAGIVHADIKPANILLDISEIEMGEKPVIRARYIDLSAAFVSGSDSTAHAGGTWDFMAPEQMRIQKDLNTPTFASDVWSLGISLLFILVGASPYAAACGSNLFMLREGIKSADPLGYAKVDPVIKKRLDTCQDFVDCCKVAFQKDRDRRLTAAAWLESTAMRVLREESQMMISDAM